MMLKKRSVLYGENILDKYIVKLLSAAYRNLEDIFTYIATELNAEQSAMNIIEKLEEAIFSLEIMPRHGAKRRVGAYANKGYRQLFVKNFTVIYRIDEEKKQVIIVAVKYSKSQF